MRAKTITVYIPEFNGTKLPLIESHVPAGFPSPAEEYMGSVLSIEEFLVDNKISTFYIRVEQDSYSMIDVGIMPKDILVVDRSLEPVHGDIIIGVTMGDFTVKEIDLSKRGRVRLIPRSSKFNFEITEITEEMDFSVWGVVTGHFGRFGRFSK